MVESMEHSYAFHRHTGSMSSLASTIIPIHSDASTSTSVTASPMELLEPLDPTVELKIPLTGLESPGSIRLEAISKPSGEGTPIPKAAVADSPRTGPPTTGYFSTGSTESKIGPYGENTNEASENISGEQPTTEWPEQAIPTAIERSTTIRLGDLKDLLRLEQYHRDQASSQQRALDGQTLADGLNRRLLAVLLMAYQAMADSYQSGDQAEFASLYQTCEDLVEACKTQPWQPLPIEDLRHSGLDPEAPASSSWFDRLPLDCQESFLDFLTRLRNDTHFLADRLSALSFGDFAELCSSSRVSQASASVFGVHQRKTSGFARTPSLPEDSSPLERLRRFFEGDPFFVLCHTVFDSSREPSTHEYQRRVQVWSTACARVITEGKPGSDEFTIATLDAFSRNKTWRLAPQLETYVARMLQDGAFLLDPASKGPTSFKEPLEIRNANAAIATSKFFDRALKELLAILVDALPASIMPEGLLELVHSVLQGIPTSEVRSRARNFIVSKWYIPSFLGRILNNPESYGMLMSHHIGSNARHTILKEIISRLQRQVFDFQYTWRGSVPVLDPGMHKLVRQLLDRFDPVSLAPADEIPPYSSDPGDDEHILMLSANDAAALIRSLFPSVSSSTASATPSTTGSSTLVSESMHDGERDKSTAASTSGISNARTTTVPFGTPQPWLDYGRASETAGNEQAPLLPGDNGIPSRDLRHRLSRVFDCLTSLALPEAKGPAAISAIDWALFGTTAHGKVRKPHALKSSKMQHHVALDGPGPVSDSVTGSVDALHLCIIQLLEQEDLNHVAFRPAADAAVNGLQETSGILEDLMRAAAHRAMADYDYQAMHYWWRMQRLLRISEGPSESLLQTIYNDGHESIKVHNHVSAGIQKQLYTLSCLRRAQVDRFQREQERRKALRMKMWYASDVRHSSPFEDALHVTQALRAMANTPRSKHSSGVANWARQRLKNVSWHDRSTAQTVEALTEPNEYSGTCKLNDDQVERTSRWLTRHSIENFCRGEERIQRFCFEVQKCVNKLTGPTLLESPVLWSSRLFEGERRSSDRKTTNTRGRGFEDSVGSSSGAPHWSSYGHLPYPPKGAQSVVNNTSKSSPILYGSSPKEPVRSLPFHTFNAPSMTPDSAWPSNSPAYGSKDETLPSKADGVRGLFTAGIKKDLFSLILSDLGYLLWHEGTETDAWVKFGSLNDDLTSPGYRHADPKPAPEVFDERHMQEPQDSRSAKGDLKLLLVEGTSAFQDPNSRWRIKDPIDASAVDDVLVLRSDQDQSPIFPFRQTYKSILERFSLSQDPQAKLRLLHELEKLVAHSIQQSLSASSSTPPSFKPNIATSLSRSQSILVPRTKATSFEEVIANCTERRAGTMRINKKPTSPWTSPDVGSFGTDEIVNTFLSIFQDLDLRPSTLFRDLQYIAAFVPAEILDQTPQGKAFWDAGLAALALKQELCDAMVSRATDITNYHISTSGPNPPPPFSPLHYNSLALTTLQDAAHLWIIAAKEGSATAARELGLLYLTHPEILPRTTLQPFSKPKEVFRMVGARKEGVHAAMEEGRLDPVTFAVVFHWMEVAASAGDRDARDFLRGNGEWGMGR